MGAPAWPALPSARWPSASCTVARRLTQEHLACWQRVEQGDPAEAIIDVAGTDKLVVMVTRGRCGLMRWALGSVADRVAHGGVAAVLLVRAGATSPTP